MEVALVGVDSLRLLLVAVVSKLRALEIEEEVERVGLVLRGRCALEGSG